jgi:predicted transcriptional regulator of viral defense system
MDRHAPLGAHRSDLHDNRLHHHPCGTRAIGGAKFELRHRSETALFGTRRVWRDRVPVEVSDRERTLLDCLDDPSLGGGLTHTAEALATYAEGQAVSWDKLIEYGDRLGNRTAFKRLGYLSEVLELAEEDLRDACLERVSAGIGRLDPVVPPTGPIVSRWGLQINARVDT